MTPLKFEIILVFPNFLTSKVLSRLTTREATRIPSLLYQISNFVLLLANEPEIKQGKAPKHSDHDCSFF